MAAKTNIASNLLLNATIKLKDGTELKENNPRTLVSIIKAQLHTHYHPPEIIHKSRSKATKSKQLVSVPVPTMEEAVKIMGGRVAVYH